MENKQTILIAGATGNIGGGAAFSLAMRGVKVVLLGRKHKTLESRADSIRIALSATQIDYLDTDIATLVVDFTDSDSIKQAAAEALNRFPEINGLILSVGHLVQNGPNVLPSGHELMFATSVLGPFQFTQLLINRLQQSNGLILQVIAPFYNEIDWDDIESIRNHKTVVAYNRAKTCERIIAAELSRRYSGKITSVAFNPSFIIDKSDSELKKRWPKGFLGFIWWLFALLFSKPPSIAGEPIADIILSPQDHDKINGVLFKLNKRLKKPDKAMNDKILGKRLWDELIKLIEQTPE
jgi:NAD(P)-dependent dehydrogenase (short-subunit alcohol dehydrogenase family)